MKARLVEYMQTPRRHECCECHAITGQGRGGVLIHPGLDVCHGAVLGVDHVDRSTLAGSPPRHRLEVLTYVRQANVMCARIF